MEVLICQDYVQILKLWCAVCITWTPGLIILKKGGD